MATSTCITSQTYDWRFKIWQYKKIKAGEAQARNMLYGSNLKNLMGIGQ